jgi:CelD/BcsL family acetyltransferase involved in cellulose biosynthesis
MAQTADPQSIRVVSDRGSLEALEAGWTALSEGRSLPTTGFPWARACSEAFTDEYDLNVVVVEAPGGRPVAIAPLALRRGSHCLEFLGAAHLDEPMDCPCEQGAVDLLAHALIAQRRPLLLRRMPSESTLVPALRRARGSTAAVLSRGAGASPRIELDETGSSRTRS